MVLSSRKLEKLKLQREHKKVRTQFTFSTVETANGCLEYLGNSFDKSGYPRFRFNGLMDNGYRHSYRLKYGKIPKGMVVRHTCNNRKCINTEHLLLGTQKQNMDDRRNAGHNPTGSMNGRAKLTEEQVLKIISTDSTFSAIAREYGVSPSIIQNIKLGRSWKHVPRNIDTMNRHIPENRPN